MKSLLISGVGIILGALVAGTIGQSLVRILGSFMGASKIQLGASLLAAYVILPFVLMLTVAITTLVSTVSMKKFSITERIIEQGEIEDCIYWKRRD